MRRRRRSRKKTLTECFAFSRVNASHKYEAATLSHSLSCCAHGAHTTHVILTTCSWSSFSSTLICMLQLCLRLSSAWFDAFYFSMQQPSFTCAANSIATTRKKKVKRILWVFDEMRWKRKYSEMKQVLWCSRSGTYRCAADGRANANGLAYDIRHSIKHHV